jgi:hypothetical protein
MLDRLDRLVAPAGKVADNREALAIEMYARGLSVR